MTRVFCRTAAPSVLVLLAQCGPAVPTRPAERLARVEFQVNNTATQADDYVPAGTGTPARIRLLNPSELTAPVPITLKNLDFQPGPQLVFGTSDTPSSATLDLTLPLDGSWVSLVVAGGGAGGGAHVSGADAVAEVGA